MSDAQPKRSRSFLCRDALWEQLERMASDLECSVDNLLDDALKLYLRRRSRLSTPLEADAAASTGFRAGPRGRGAHGRLRRRSPPGHQGPVRDRRGRREVDLVIRDPNVSRLHAMVELCGGQYFLVDLGSTNGVEHMGQRIARKPIAEGEVIRICDHEVRFTFRS